MTLKRLEKQGCMQCAPTSNESSQPDKPEPLCTTCMWGCASSQPTDSASALFMRPSMQVPINMTDLPEPARLERDPV